MTHESPCDRASIISSATGGNDVYNDALSHADVESFATPTAASRPETPHQLESAAGSVETPQPPPGKESKDLEAAGSRKSNDTTLDRTPTTRRTRIPPPTEDRASTSEDEEKETESQMQRLRAKETSPTSSRDEVSVEGTAENSAAISLSAAAETRQSKEEVTAVDVEAPDAPPENDAHYLSGIKLYLLSIGLFFATFVIALDNTIIATAIPKITAEFNSLDDVGWYGSAYLLTTTSLQPSFGKIFSYFNVKWMYIMAVVIFETGSVVCATAPNSTSLIVGRAVAGLGAAGLFSGGITIVGYSVPLRRRAIYIAILSSTFGIASIVGPILGGVFTDSVKLTWRFCFWINLPVGGIAILTTGLFFTSPPRKNLHLGPMEKLRRMDLAGAFILIGAICCLLLALQWGGTTYQWSDSRVWGTLLGFGLILVVFIAMQIRTGEHATVPPRIISKRGVAVGAAFMAFLSFSLFAHIFYLPFYFQAVKGTTAEGSGIRTIPYLVSNTLASIVVGACITVFGPYTPFLWFGSAVFTIGAGMLYRLQVDSSSATWIGFQLLAGIGAGCAIQVPFISAQVVLDIADMPTGNALTIFFNTLGGAISVSVCQNIFSNELAKQLEASVPPLIIEIVSLAGATGVHEAVPPQYLPAVLQAYNDAVTKTFIVPIVSGSIAFLITLAMPWGSVKGKNLIMGAA